MNAMLEETFEKIRQLPDHAQAEAQAALEQVLAEAAAMAENDEDLKDPDCRAHVEDALAQSEADVAAGRVYTTEEIRARSGDRLDRLYGVVPD